MIITYGKEANDNTIYGCLGDRQFSSATDTYEVQGRHLYCNDKPIALGVTSLSASIPTSGGVFQKGVDVTLKIEGMPENMKANGFTFSLAMRQRIVIDSAVSDASASSAGLITN